MTLLPPKLFFRLRIREVRLGGSFQLCQQLSLCFGFPGGTPITAPCIEICPQAEVIGCTKDTVCKRNRSRLTWFEYGETSMCMKLMQRIPEPMQRIADNYCEGYSYA